MGKLLIEKVRRIMKGIVLTLSEWGKAASYAIQH
ncbi:hypothetical protein EV195_101101 [Tenacibaculum skagerrakense]|uniref:Uncharacterized protein n=1 Tax=Tenacibaculum skagerrakense TaxID=186571 RepID=A0A4R2P0B7_9FLAO|nr:hypothetical protein EV195_101101 [Tenacibaculum skagerrakense]